MENLQNILFIVYGVCSIVLSVICVILNKKKGKTNEPQNEEQVQDVQELDKTELLEKTNIILESLCDFMVQAEKSGMTGLAKKTYVMSQVVEKCAQIKVDYSLVVEYISKKVEDLINFSKNVNCKKETTKNEGNSNNQGIYI